MNDGWPKERLPDAIKKLPDVDAKEVIIRFSNLVDRRPAPSKEYPNRVVFWPRPPLRGRAIPEGVFPLDETVGYDHAENLDRFFASIAPGGVVLFGIGMERHGVFSGCYNSEMRTWLRRELVFSPLCILGREADVVLLVDDQLRFSVCGGSESVIASLEREFGGADALRSSFLNYVEEYGVGFGESDREWAEEFLIPWSGWRPS